MVHHPVLGQVHVVEHDGHLAVAHLVHNLHPMLWGTKILQNGKEIFLLREGGAKYFTRWGRVVYKHYKT